MAVGTELVGRFKPGANLPVYALGAQIEPGRFISISGRNARNAYVGAHTGAGLHASGVSQRTALADVTDHRGGTEIMTGGVPRMVAGAAIPLLAGGQTPVKSVATGRAIPQGGTGLILGYALGPAAAAAGDIIDIQLAL